jgi:hypothetical protein
LNDLSKQDFFGEGGMADNIVGALPVVPILWSLRRLFEISQIGRRLILLGGHQESIPVQEIVFRADDDQVVALGARRFAPVWAQTRIAPKCLVHAPRPRQGTVEHGDLVMKNIRIALVEMEPLLEKRLVVEGQRQAA